jgi:hypothetical protein
MYNCACSLFIFLNAYVQECAAETPLLDCAAEFPLLDRDAAEFPQLDCAAEFPLLDRDVDREVPLLVCAAEDPLLECAAEFPLLDREDAVLDSEAAEVLDMVTAICAYPLPSTSFLSGCWGL